MMSACQQRRIKFRVAFIKTPNVIGFYHQEMLPILESLALQGW